jgi:hypothetical protein
MELLEEIWDEVTDFFEDLFEHLVKQHPKETKESRQVVIDGVVTTVRPAYLFAARVDNLLRIIFGASVVASALTATVLGFSSLSGLVDTLISTLWGRLLLFLIGASYLTIGLWKSLHLTERT